jgi:hypothetical protein
MEVLYQATPTIQIKLEVKGIKELFEELGPLQEIFSSMKCGHCSAEADKIRLIHRKAADKYSVYELLCTKCKAKLALGQNEDGGLFPRRYERDDKDPKKPKTKEGKRVYLPNNGWVKWTPQDNKQEE